MARVVWGPLLGLVMTACQSDPPPAEEPEPVPEQTVEAPEPVVEEASGEPAPEQALDTPEAPTETPRLVPLMQALGYTAEDDIDIAEFVHAPPGAQAEAASFGNGEDQVRVALVVYPNPRYAEPHYNDVRERTSVIPGSSEEVLRREQVVIHLRAVDRDHAVAVRDAIAAQLGWTP